MSSIETEFKASSVSTVEREASTVIMDYKLMDHWGRVYLTGQVEGFELGQVPAGATYVEATIETPFGNFILGHALRKAKEVIKEIQEYVK